MAGRPKVTSSDATGAPVSPSLDIPSRVAVIGAAYQGTTESKFYSRRSQVYSQYLEGPLVRGAAHCIDNAKLALITQKCAASNPGAYDTIDNSGVTGTCVPAVVATAVPRNECELYAEVIEGGTVGTDGITYKTSTENGRIALSGLKRLGTGSRITFGNTGCEIELDPPEAALVTYVADLRTQTLAHLANVGNLDEVITLANELKRDYEEHRVLTAGSVHGAADNTNAVSAANATDLATAITLLNELKVDYEAHRVLTGGSEHGAADNTNAVTAADATNLATAVALANDLRTQYEAHRVLTSGSVHGAADNTNAVTATITATHGAADSTSGSGIAAAPTTRATARSCLITLIAAAKLHVVLTSGSVHGASDSTALAALNAITLAADSTFQATRLAALAYADAMFGDGATANDAHTLRIAASVHGIEDTTSLVTASSPTGGTLVAGDIIRCQTFAPYPSTAELAAAFATLAESAYTPGIVLLPGRTPASYHATITAGLDLMQANGKPVRCIVQARRFVSGSDVDLETFRDNLESEWGTAVVNDDRILVCATDALCTLSDGTASLNIPAQRLTGFAVNFTVRRLKKPFYQTTWAPSDGALNGVSLVDSDGIMIGWDEPDEVDTRLQVLYQVPDALTGRPTVASIDYVLAGEDSRIKSQRVGLIRDEIDRHVRSFAWSEVGLLAFVTITSPGVGTLNEDKRQDLIRRCAARLQRHPDLPTAISDIDASDLVSLDSTVTVDGDIVYLEFTTNWTPAAAVGRINTTHAVRTGD